VTHPHRDHLDDITNFDLLSPIAFQRPSHLSEAEIRAANQRFDAPIIDAYLQIHRRYTRSLEPTEVPETPANNGGVVINSFHPSICATTELNNHSIVTFLTYAGSTICLPGDNEAASWNELLADPSFRVCLAQTNVLIASHHGREAGYCESIFADGLCSPTLVVISDGPASDTSAVAKYHRKASGWEVESRSSGHSEMRHVLTTRCDGIIEIRCYCESGQNYLHVSID
jgi:competence protein ComEC